MGFPNQTFSTPPKHLVNDATRGAPLGQRMVFPDGRRFSYGLVGATTLISGDIIQGKAVISGDYETVVSDVAPAIGDSSISLTTTTSTAANYYDGGWIHCNLATTLLQGAMHRVKASGSHAVFVSEAGHVVQLDPVDPIRVVGTTASEFGLVPDEYNGMILAPQTTLTSRVIGVAQAPITNAQHGYVQTWGMCALQAAASQVVGENLCAVIATAGRAGIGADDVTHIIAIALNVNSSAGEEGSAFLLIE